MPLVMTEILPLWLGTLMLAAIFSAEVSTADAVLFMLTTSIGKDLYKGMLRPGASDEQLLRFTRWCAVACGAGGAVCALLLETVIGALTIFYSIITAVFFLPLVGGLYWSRLTAQAALASILVAASALFLLEALQIMFLGIPSLALAIAAGALAIIICDRYQSRRPRS
jgi:SSS family solute:Na+ symporter